VWLCGAAGVLIYAPAAVIQLIIDSGRLSLAGLAFMAGSAVFHVGYFNALQRGYRMGDLSLVYPLAPVILVAPAREVSIVFGVLIGANTLGEGQTVRRTVAAVAILSGIVLLALS
jgi:uncharacterized membrane protein